MSSFKAFLATALAVLLATGATAEPPAKHVLLLGQKRDHPPGTHEYMPGLRILAECLRQQPGLEVTLAEADEPFAAGPELIGRADAVVLYLGEGAKWAADDPARAEALRKFAARRGAFVALHWAVGAKEDRYVPAFRELLGAVHGGADRKYVVTQTDLRVAQPRHPIASGIGDFPLDDEYYYHLKTVASGKLAPVLTAQIDGRPELAAWGFERADGGRSFGFVAMHNHKNWERVECRRLIVQGILWTLDLPIPADGVPVDVPKELFTLE